MDKIEEENNDSNVNKLSILIANYFSFRKGMML